MQKFQHKVFGEYGEYGILKYESNIYLDWDIEDNRGNALDYLSPFLFIHARKIHAINIFALQYFHNYYADKDFDKLLFKKD